MIFFVTTLNQQGEALEFSLSGDLEAGIKLFDHIGQKGDTLLQATIVDGRRSIDIPLESFYGRAWLPALEALEDEWKHILSKPISPRSVPASKLADLIFRRIERHKVCISHLEQIISVSEQRLQHIFDTIHREPLRTRVLHQLEGALKRHQQNLATERVSLDRAYAHSEINCYTRQTS
jgi:hypothetical protein